MSEESYPQGEVFCPICNKRLTTAEDIERGFHNHCEARGGLNKEQMSELFCEDKHSK